MSASKRLPRRRAFRSPVIRPATIRCRITEECRELVSEFSRLAGAAANGEAASNVLNMAAYHKAKRIARRGATADDLATLAVAYTLAPNRATASSNLALEDRAAASILAAIVAKAAGVRLRAAVLPDRRDFALALPV